MRSSDRVNDNGQVYITLKNCVRGYEMDRYDIIIIGGGPAGLAAAISAYDEFKAAGTDKPSVLILERDVMLGGILNQCIHNGFGLHTFKEELTGPEYAARFIDKVLERNIEYRLSTMVLSIGEFESSYEHSNEYIGVESATDVTISRSLRSRHEVNDENDHVITAINREDGLSRLCCRKIILAMGCRERPRGALNIPGYRPAGIFTAGTAQRLVNIEGYMPGREVVILGSGDIGLIMARRMTLEGAKVKAVAELMPYSGGLKRNIVQCLDDFGIPLLLSHTVVDIKGKERVEAVIIAEVDANLKPIPGTEEEYKCDTLLLSCGLLPENELSTAAGVEMNPATNGPKVYESMETFVPGIYACGNVLHVHDLVDYVSEEAANAGKYAARQCLREDEESGGGKAAKDAGPATDGATDAVAITTGNGVRYTVPVIVRPDVMEDEITVRFRVANVYKNCYIDVYADDTRISHRKRQIVSPGEMENVKIGKDAVKGIKNVKILIDCES